MREHHRPRVFQILRGGDAMTEPVKVGDGWFDKSEVAAVLRQGGKLLVFLKSGKPVTLPDNMSAEELEALIGK